MAKTLYLVVSGASAPEGVPDLVRRLQSDGYTVVCLSTPVGTRFHAPDELEKLTGEPVRVEYRMPGTGKSLPPADLVVACPLTFNSVNKFANGHADNFAIGLLCKMVGYNVPTIVVPHCKPQLAAHPAFQRSLDTLRDIPAVTLVYDHDAPYESRLPTWEHLLRAIRDTMDRPPSSVTDRSHP
ncbi:flavoprotein [Nocardiopsis sp. EMB25]|uniref:flavoprotein n=1 Tax=Nocardiopsis sp. EMB25 TaxID=2835867 RepID=UPI0022843468|nr:flavoprotein [Nocardiopsis sp. EMB25]MCY9785766.1 flavoprotein [Nocardiopsis sp. EMB25]